MPLQVRNYFPKASDVSIHFDLRLRLRRRFRAEPAAGFRSGVGEAILLRRASACLTACLRVALLRIPG
jgi:hypothetical protein